jgi:pimeloyl-ACP methyl ester carboxylesterase
MQPELLASALTDDPESSTTSTSAPLPELRRLSCDPQQRYWICRPLQHERTRIGPLGLLVSVHGISRNARAHAHALAPLAQALNLLVVAPHFSAMRFPDYQRLGRPARLGTGGRADQILLRIVNAVRAESGLPEQPFALLGHSGGAQFALRFALVHPEHVACYVLSAAGSYCWPDEQRRFPHGLAVSPAFKDLEPKLASLLRRPGLVLVGERDVERCGALRQGARIDAVQGRTRKERAEHWVAAMLQRADEQGPTDALVLRTVAGCGHAFSEMARSPAWRGAIAQHLSAGLQPAPRQAANPSVSS